MPSSSATPLPAPPWWAELGGGPWRALAAAKIGLMVDAFDVMLFTFCLKPIMEEWRLTPARAGGMMTLTLVAAAVGGALIGTAADRFGRRNALLATLALFSLCSVWSGLARSPGELALARTLLGLAMGGEWAAGALLVSESWPARHRAKGIGLMQGGWALGYLAAALVTAALLSRWGWRALFFLGAAPALFGLWVRSGVAEPALWTRPARGEGRGLLQLFGPDLRRTTVVCTLTASLAMLGYWGLFSWLPTFLVTPVALGGAGLASARGPLWMVPMLAGAYAGYLSFGWFADRFGRRPAFAAFLALSAGLACLYGNTRSPLGLMLLGPFIGFFGSGQVAAFGVLAAELFPTRARGAALGFTFNTGRAVSAVAPLLIGLASARVGPGAALAFTAVAFVLAALSLRFIPETLGRALT
jgi:MFS family permease